MIPHASLEDLFVMSIYVGDFIELSQDIDLAGLRKYVEFVRPMVADTISTQGGSIVRYPAGEWIVVWPAGRADNDRRPRTAVEGIFDAFRRQSDLAIEKGFPRQTLSIGLARGQCIVEGETGGYSDVLGGPVNRYVRLREQAKRMNYFVLADNAAAALWASTDRREIAPGIFSLKSGSK